MGDPINATGRSWRHAPAWAQRAGMAIDATALGLVVTSPIVVGGMFPWAQALYSLVAVGLLCATGLIYSSVGARWRWSPVVPVLAGVALLTLFRASPMGAILASGEEREVYALWEQLRLRGTIAPGRAPLAALRLLGFAALVQVWATRFRRRGGTRRTLRAVVWTLALCALIGLVHFFLGLDDLYGVWQSQQLVSLHAPLAAPFINENQVGALYGLVALVLLGMATVRSEHRLLTVLTGVGLLLYTEFALHAHAAFIAGLVASTALLISLLLPMTNPKRYARVLVALAVTSSLMAIMAAWVFVPSRPELAGFAPKATVWADAIPAALHRPFGYGPGAFPDIFGSYSRIAWPVRFDWVESVPLQAAIEHGVLATAAVTWVFALIFVRAVHTGGTQRVDTRAATAGIGIYIVCEAVAGMGLEAMGYLFPVAALIGLTEGRTPAKRGTYATRRGLVGGLAALLSVLVLCLPGLTSSIRLGDFHVGRMIQPLAAESGFESDALAERIHALAHLVPGDIVLLSFESERTLAAANFARSTALAERLEVVAPGRSITWELGVAVAAAAGDEALACRRAIHLVDTAPDSIRLVRALQRIESDPRLWLGCVSGLAARQAIYEGLEAEGRVDEGLAVALTVLRSEPDDAPSLRMALRGLVAMESHSYAIELGTRLANLAPTDSDAGVLVARSHAELSQHAQAVSFLDRILIENPDDISLQLERLAALSRWTDPPEPTEHLARFEAEYERLVVMVTGEDRFAARRLRIGGRFYRNRENWRKAENAYRALLRIYPEDSGALAGLEYLDSRRARHR